MRKPLICPHCDRPTGRPPKGAPKLPPKCARCPGQPTTARVVEPYRDLRIAYVDAGVTSGFAVSHRGEVEIVDSINVWTHDPDLLCSDLVAADVALFVIEKSARSSTFGTSPEGSIAIWKRAWILAGGAKTRIARLHTSTWRSVALSRSKELAREEWKAIAVREASGRFHATARRWMREGEVVEPRPGSVAWDENTADAALGLWAALRLPEIHEAIPATLRKKAASA